MMTEQQTLSITILGAGAIGCLYGLHLAERHHLTFLAKNEERIRKIRENGLVFREDGRETIRRIRIASSGTLLPVQDMVLVTVKAHQLEQAVRENKLLLQQGAPIVCLLMNGGDNARFLRGIVPAERLVLATTTHNAMRFPNHLIQHTAWGTTCVGPDSDAGRLVAETLKAAGFPTHVEVEIRRVIWKKLFVNAVINPLTALHGVRNGVVVSDPRLFAQVPEILSEGIAAAEREGFAFSLQDVCDQVLQVARETAEGESSMLQDLRRGHLTEIDEINGVVVRFCGKHGLPCPRNSELVRRIHDLEKSSPGSLRGN